jgi:hypothetical protein
LPCAGAAIGAANAAASTPWLGLNGNHLNFLGPVDFFANLGMVYDRVEFNAGEVPQEGARLTGGGEALDAAMAAGMVPVIPIEYEGYSGHFGSDPNFPTTQNGRLSSYVQGFVKTAKAILQADPSEQVLLEPMNEPWGYTTPQYNGAEYAAVIASLLPQAKAAGIPLNDIYIAAYGADQVLNGAGQPQWFAPGWIPAMYEAQPQLRQ